MPKIVHVQTVMEETRLEQLKIKTGQHATKDAVSTAIDHYFDCKTTKGKN